MIGFPGMPRLVLLAAGLMLSACTGVAEGITPVGNFKLDRYLGKWYEIARLDHDFERGLERVTAEYSLRDDGGVRVLNSGYSADSGKRETAEGKAFFVAGSNVGHLKVSFFGPFYGSYVIFKLDEDNYDYAFITSYNKSYLWLLARTPEVDRSVVDEFLRSAKSNGFDTDEIIFVKQG